MTSFKVPTQCAFFQRQIFHSCQKQSAESVCDWYERIETCLSGCDYGDLSAYMFIDKFISGVDINIYEKLNPLNCVTLDQLQSIAKSYDEIKEEVVDQYEFFFDERPTNADSDDHFSNGCEFDYNYLNEGEKTEQTDFQQIVTKPATSTSIASPPKKQLEQESNSNDTKDNIDNEVDPDYDAEDDVAEPKNKDIEIKKKTNRKMKLCNICTKTFHSNDRLRRHLAAHEHDGRTFICYLCPYEFKLWNSLRGHFSAKHIARRTGQNCGLCNKSFFSKKTLDEHLQIHRGIGEGFQCTHCLKVFDTRKRMSLHEKVHSDFKRFVCETCGHAVRTSKELEIHRRKHSDARPFECTICGQFLKSLTYMKNHMRQHTGERPFQCELCSKTFIQRANYHKHLRVHRQDRPHPCSMCGKRFMTAYDLKVHTNVHTGTKPFQCPMCNLAFTQPGTLRHHKLRIHADLMQNEK